MRRAFTLLELLAATALSALLMVAVLHVMGTIGRDRRTLAGQPGPQVWRADLLDTLRRDLAGSDTVRYGNNTLTLTGRSALDRRDLSPTDEPVIVTYGIVVIHERSWLTRRQSARTGSGSATPWVEMLCPDVVRFDVRAVDAIAGGAAPLGPAAPQAVPASVMVRIEIAGEAPVEETLVLR